MGLVRVMGSFAVMSAKINAEMAAVARENAKTAYAAGYLCGECAEALGGKWPRGHRATFRAATCPICKVCRPIASWDDWDWPKAPEVNEVAKRTREV